MGWNSWNTFGGDISEKLILETADAMVKDGYRDAGYEYVNLDDCWLERERDTDGKLVPDKQKFPHGLKAVGDYLHERGLKFGLYSCAGVMTCAGFPGGYGHEFSDAKQYAEWGVDLLKYDYCNKPETADGRMCYLTMSQALRASGREILFSACNWGYDDPEKWMRPLGAHMYRSDTDIRDNYISFRDIAMRQIRNFAHSTSGCFNDIDMLTVGMRGHGHVAEVAERYGQTAGMTEIEYTTHFAFWCFMGAPLLMGGDLRRMDEFGKTLLLNRELIALDQDAECRPPFLATGVKPYLDGAVEGSYVLTRFLADGELAFGFFNFKDKAVDARLLFADAGLPPQETGHGFELRDILNDRELGVCVDGVRAILPAHGCLILRGRLTERVGKTTVYLPIIRAEN